MLHEAGEPLLARPQGLLGPHPLGDVLDHGDDTGRSALAVPDQRDGRPRPDHPPVLADEALLDRVARRPLGDPGELLPVPRRVVRVGDVPEPQAEQCLLRVADDLAVAVVGPEEAAGQIHLGDADGGLVVHRPVLPLALPQRLLGPPAVVDVGGRPEPPGRAARLVGHRDRADEVPAVGPVPAAQPDLGLEDLALTDPPVPHRGEPAEVVGVDGRPPALAQGRLGRHPGVLVPAGVEVVHRAVRPGRPDDLGHRVGQVPEPRLARPQCLLGLPPLGDIPQDEDDARDLPPVVLDGGGVVLDRPRRPAPVDEDRRMARGDGLPPYDPGDGEVGRPVDRPLDGAEDLRQGATGRLVPARAGEPLGGRIQGGDPPSGVGRDHGVADAGQGDAVPFPLGLLGFERPPGLGGAGPGPAAGVPHGPAEQGDDQPGGEEGEDDLGPIREDRPRATGSQEEVIGGQPGEGDGQERGSEAAVPGGDADGDDEGEEGEAIAQEGVEGESDGRRQGDRDRCDAIAQGGSQGGIGHLIAVRDVPVGLDGLGTDHRRGGVSSTI